MYLLTKEKLQTKSKLLCIWKKMTLVFLCVAQIIVGVNVFTGALLHDLLKKKIDEPPFNAK